MKTRKLLNSFVVLSVLLGLVMTNTAFASDNGQNDSQNRSEKSMTGGLGNAFSNMWTNLTHRGGPAEIMKKADSISGTVSSVTGNTLMVSVLVRNEIKPEDMKNFGTSTRPMRQGFGTSSKPEFNRGMRPQLATSTTVVYTVDATNAKIYSGRATTTVSSITAGEMVFVQGQVTGQNVVANLILVEKAPVAPAPKQDNQKVEITGNGQPVVAGTISAVSTSTLTITNNSNVTYTVDMTNAKVFQNNEIASSSSLVAGNMVIVQGAINGNSITASTVIDQNGKGGKDVGKPEPKKGFFGNIGGFFSKLFGF